MNTCENCLFCRYRNARIAAAGAAGRAVPGLEHHIEQAQLSPSPSLPLTQTSAPSTAIDAVFVESIQSQAH